MSRTVLRPSGVLTASNPTPDTVTRPGLQLFGSSRRGFAHVGVELADAFVSVAGASEDDVRLLLDTNVWSGLAGRDDAGEAFYRWAKVAPVTVVVAPATLLEVMRTSNPARRQLIARLVTRARWTRLPTEAESESNEVLAELRRLRPAWVRSVPDRAHLAGLRRLWQHEMWRAARRDAPALVEHAGGHAAVVRQQLPGLQKQQASGWRASGFVRSLDDVAARLTDTVAWPAEEEHEHFRALGWRPGTKVAPWRLAAVQELVLQ